MDDSNKVFRILYVGGDTRIVNDLEKRSDLFELEHVENGLAAITTLDKDDFFDCILAEEVLSGMNSFDLLKMVMHKNIIGAIPYIIVSHDPKSGLIKEALQNKVDDVYTFPIDPEKLHTRIRFRKYFRELQRDRKPTVDTITEYKIPFIKRAFDIIVSGFALLLLSPLFLLIVIAIKLESKGPIFYTSKRVGTGYKIFDFYKFRSMYIGAEAKLRELEHLNKYMMEAATAEVVKPVDCPRCTELPEGEYCSPTLYKGGEKICEYWFTEQKKRKGKSVFVKIKNDPRITSIGKLIRNSSIDELPQLFNVFKGDMSIVGNRPLPLYEAELLTSDDWSARFLGPAGITGLWQVELRGKKGEMSEEERKALDNQYSRTYSFWGDLKLILRTIPALFQKENV